MTPGTERRTTRRRKPYRTERAWSAEEVRALRQHLGLTQESFSERLGMRQQTVSEWEVGKHRPRGASITLLNVIAESADFRYRTDADQETGVVDGRPTGDASRRA